MFVQEAKIENAAPAITKFVQNICKLFACNAITNGLKIIESIVSIILQFSKRFETVSVGLQF